MEGILDTPTEARNRGLNVVPIEFWKEHEPDGSGGFRPVDYVKWGKRGDQNTIVVEKVARVMKPLGRSEEDGTQSLNPVWVAIQPAYRAWQQGQEAPVDGTPLDAWAAVSKGQAKALKAAGFAAVEHVANMTDADLSKARLPDVRRLRDLARAFVTNKERDAPIEAALAERDAKLASQAEQMAEMQAQLAEAMAALKRLGDDKPQHGKRA